MNYIKVDKPNKEKQKGDAYYANRKKAALKKIALELCTCTWIEILTGAGITHTSFLVLMIQGWQH
jgi:hypothetical protein